MNKSFKWTLIVSFILALVVVVVVVSVNKADDIPDVDIWTAASQGNTGAVEKHIATGTDIDAVLVVGITKDTPGYGGTPLHIAVLSNQEEVVEILLENGADIEAKSDSVSEAAYNSSHSRITPQFLHL